MTIKHRLARILILTAVAAGAVITTAAPASAASSCNSFSTWKPGNNMVYNKPTLGNETFNTNCVLGVGNQGQAVTVLQDSLKRCYGQGIAVDGIYGPMTRQAVINVQRAVGVSQDGVFGPITSGRMVWPRYEFVNSWPIFRHC